MKLYRSAYEPIYEGRSTRFQKELDIIEDLGSKLEEDFNHWRKKSNKDWNETGIDLPDFIENEEDSNYWVEDEVNGESFVYDKFDCLNTRKTPRAHMPASPKEETNAIWPATIVKGFIDMKEELAAREKNQFNSLDELKASKNRKLRDFEEKLKKINR